MAIAGGHQGDEACYHDRHGCCTQVKIDWDNINSKVDAEYKQERERPSAIAQQVR